MTSLEFLLVTVAPFLALFVVLTLWTWLSYRNSKPERPGAGPKRAGIEHESAEYVARSRQGYY